MDRICLTRGWRLIAALGLMCWLAGESFAGGYRVPLAASCGVCLGQAWGEPVDGLACRLLMEPRYTIGQAISAVIEVKNVSDKKRWFVPRLYPSAVKHVTLEVTGPQGNVKQTNIENDAGTWLGESQYQSIGPGEIRRFEVNDLRNYFSSLSDWDYGRTLAEAKVFTVPTGKYTVQMRFRSPKVPDRFIVNLTFVNDKAVYNTKEVPAEVTAGQWAREIVAAPVSFELAPLAKEDFAVHEWGVFTVYNDVKYAGIDRKEEWGSLPTFFYRQFPQERLRWMPSAWDKPVVYFYAKPSLMRIYANVTFTDGAPVVWWPAAVSPIEERPYLTGPNPNRPGPFRSLSWEGWLGDRVPPLHGKDPLIKVDDFPLPEKSWLSELRLPQAARFTVVGNMEKGIKRFPGALDRYETERFIYYDGLVPSPNYVRCEKVEDEAVTFRNLGKLPVADLFIVDRRVKDKVRFGAFPDARGGAVPLKPGQSARFELKPAQNWPAAGIQRVQKALVDAGLFEAEADSLLRIWHKKFFEADGITAFHLLPADEYNRMLPLSILPAPAEKPVRAGVALHPHVELEPDLTARVARLVRQLDDDNFKKRDAASRELLEIGPVAISLLQAELSKNLSAEAASRIRNVLDRVDAAEWLNLRKK